MSATETRALWVGYGTNGVVGNIRQDAEGYTVTLAGAEEAAGVYPSLEAAKGALHARTTPGSPWPRFQQH